MAQAFLLRSGGISDEILQIEIIFAPDFVGKTFTITSGDFEYDDVVPDNLISKIPVPMLNTMYIITSNDTTMSITIGNFFGIYSTSFPEIPTIPQIIYSGEMSIFESTHPFTDTKRFFATLLSSGNLFVNIDSNFDVFLVGGGGGGGTSIQTNGYGASGGGGGGYTKTIKGVNLLSNISIPVIIGAGGAGGVNIQAGTTSFGEYSVSGGYSPAKSSSSGGGDAGHGGSGGGNSRNGSVSGPTGTFYGGNGGSNGSNGNIAIGGTFNQGELGIGQGSTTYAFDGDVMPFNSMLFAGGGGGGAWNNYYGGGGFGGAGGDGGGGKGQGPETGNGTAGEANTGGGGGGVGRSGTTTAVGYSGGSGIVIIRWGDWSV